MKQKEYAEQLLPLVENVLPMACRILGCQAKAEDVVQEVMLSLWEQRNTLKITVSHKAFLYRAVRNKCLDKLKQVNKLHFDTAHEIENKSNGATEEFDTMQWIQQCIATLPKVQQNILNMREIDGLAYCEISELLELKESHVRVLLSRAKKTLQEVIPKGLE